MTIILPAIIILIAPIGTEFYVVRDGYFYKYDEDEDLLWWCHQHREWIELKKHYPERNELIPIK